MKRGLGEQPTFIHFLVSSTWHKKCLLKNHILHLLNKISRDSRPFLPNSHGYQKGQVKGGDVH